MLGNMFGDSGGEIQREENLPYGWLAHWEWATMAAKIRPVRVTHGDVIRVMTAKINWSLSKPRTFRFCIK